MQAAQAVAEELARSGLATTVRDVAHGTPADLPADSLVVLGSCSWLRQTADGPQQGALPAHMHRFVQALLQQKRPGRPFAVFAFGRHEYTKFCGAADHLEEAVRASGGYLVTDSLRVDGFFAENEAAIREWARSVRSAINAAPVGSLTENS